MIRTGRASQAIEHSTPSGVDVRLVADTWWILVGRRNGGALFCYRRPRGVESGTARIPIHDYNGMIRALSLVVLLVSPLMRRLRS